MSKDKKSNGIGFGTVLFLVFLILKLTNNITWSWWWVTSPLWIPLVIVIFCFIVLGFIKYISNEN
jgi:uncharacterized membrane protein